MASRRPRSTCSDPSPNMIFPQIPHIESFARRFQPISRVLFPDAVHEHQAAQLLPLNVLDQISFDTRHTAEVTGNEAVHQSHGADDNRTFDNSFDALQKHEQRVVARYIVGSAVFDRVLPAAFGLASGTEVDDLQFGKRSRLPIEHVRSNFVDGVPPGARQKATYRIPTFATINLRGPAHMKLWAGFQDIRIADDVIDHAAANTEGRVFVELSDTVFEIVGFQPHITVKFDQEVPVPPIEELIPLMESLHYA